MVTKKESKASKSPGKASLTRVPVYNPLELTNLGDGIKRAIETCALLPLEDVTEFESAGLYLLYTTGSTKSFPEYRSVEEANSHGRFEKPI